MSSLFQKILHGLSAIGGAVVGGFEGAMTGVMAGALLGPGGAAAGAIAGAIIGVGLNAGNVYSFLKETEEPTIDSTMQSMKRGTDAAIAYSILNPNDPESKVIQRTLDGVRAGGTWRSSFQAAGGHQFGRMISEGGIQGLVNRSAAQLGISPVTAMAQGNGAYRRLISKVGPNSVFSGNLNSAILASAHPIAGSAISS